LEGSVQFILVEWDAPGRRDITVLISRHIPGLVGEAGIVVAIIGNVQDLALHNLAGGEAGAGDRYNAARRVIWKISRYGLRKARWRYHCKHEKNQPPAVKGWK
jgi:hypothetical protein